MELAPDFNEFFELLNAHRVEYVLVGGYALALHGAPRYTGDLDILVRPTPENADRLLTAVGVFGFPTDALSVARIIDPRCLLQMGTSPVQLHVMSAIDGVTWDQVWEGHEVAVLQGLPIPFIGREAFLQNKRAAGRTKDLADIEAIGGKPDGPDE
jgi:hypothetical protein